MDNRYATPASAPEPGFSPDTLPGLELPYTGASEFGAPDRDFPAIVPARTELPGRPLSRDELDFIPQQDEF